MTAPDLPAELRAALDAKLQGLSRRDAAGRAAVISQTYRGGGGSGAIRSETDALAYAFARMPATYAVVTASLNALRENIRRTDERTAAPVLGNAPQDRIGVGRALHKCDTGEVTRLQRRRIERRTAGGD